MKKIKKTNNKQLTLNKDAIRHLLSNELTSVAGGIANTHFPCSSGCPM
jgi:hypothetical protein